MFSLACLCILVFGFGAAVGAKSAASVNAEVAKLKVDIAALLNHFNIKK